MAFGSESEVWDCNSLVESRKTGSTIIMTLTIDGTSIRTDTSNSTSQTTSIAGTQTKTLTRQAFNPRDYYKNNKLPEIDNFYLGSECCCWKCRPVFIFNDRNHPTSVYNTRNFSFPYRVEYTGVGSPPPIDSSLSIQLELFIPRGGTKTTKCKNSDDIGNGIVFSLNSDPIFLDHFTSIESNFSYSDSIGNSESGITNNLTLLPPNISTIFSFYLDFCNESTNFDATINYSGNETHGNINYANDLNISTTFSFA